MPGYVSNCSIYTRPKAGGSSNLHHCYTYENVYFGSADIGATTKRIYSCYHSVSSVRPIVDYRPLKEERV